VFPDACACCDKSASGVPVDVGYTIVISSIHELQVGGEVLVTLWFFAFEIHIKELHVETLLRVHGSNDDEAALW
jgi:hypothetical protein